MKKTMYELLGMVKDGKVPEKIKYNNKIYFAKGNATEGFAEYFSDEDEWGFNHYVRYENLNKEVEILEEPKGIPEKLDHLIGYDIRQFDDLKEYVEITTNDLFGKVNKIIDTLNQLLDYLESKGDE